MIKIFANSIFAGEGQIEDGRIVNCPAVLGDHVFEAIEEALDSNKDHVFVEGVKYTWEHDSDQLKEYTVIWEIEVTAKSPEEAARLAHAIQVGEDRTLSSSYEVGDGFGDYSLVDVAGLEDN